MKIFRILTINLIFLLLGFNASSQIGVSDRINQENDRAPSIDALEVAAIKELARGNNYGAMRCVATDGALAVTKEPRALNRCRS